MIGVAIAAPLLVRAGLRAVLGEAGDIEVTAEAGSLVDLAGLPDLLEDTDVLLVVGDAAAQGEAGASFLTSLRRLLRGSEDRLALLWLADRPQAVQNVAGMPWRALGLLPLEAAPDELAAALRALVEGLWVGTPELVAPLLRRGVELAATEDEAPIEPLTDREAEVLQLLVRGLANKQIAVALGISEHTVKFHISSIYAKLDASNRTEAVRVGLQRGLVVL